MAFAVKRLYQAQLTNTLSTVLYTNPGGVTTIIKNVTVTNDDNAARQVTIGWPGSAAGSAIFDALTLGVGETVDWEGHQVLLSGETITGGCDAASKVTVHISGVEG